MPGQFVLTLDGVNVGSLKSAAGGQASADVINEPPGPSSFVKKHIGRPKYEDLIMQAGLCLSKLIYDCVADSWKGNYQRKNGSVLFCDSNFMVKSEREFFNSLITETTIPAMDGSSKDPCYMTLKFRPEYTRFKTGSGKAPTPDPGLKQQVWLPSNFRLAIAGLDCTKVNKIDGFTVKHSTSKIDFPNLRISLSESSAKAWIEWHEDFVIKGNSGEANEKNGSLTFLASDLKTELATINFFNLGIFSLSLDDSDDPADQIKRFTAELYCEHMEFHYGAKPA